MISSFRGDFDFLSNFYILQHPIIYGWMSCATSEHLYQALKSKDNHFRAWVNQATTPKEAQDRGRVVQLREDWNTGFNKVAMHLALILKFTTNDNLLIRLIATNGRELIEGNHWHDNYWGNCSCTKCINKPGQNNLGILLMQVRALFLQIGQ